MNKYSINSRPKLCLLYFWVQHKLQSLFSLSKIYFEYLLLIFHLPSILSSQHPNELSYSPHLLLKIHSLPPSKDTLRLLKYNLFDHIFLSNKWHWRKYLSNRPLFVHLDQQHQQKCSSTVNWQSDNRNHRGIWEGWLVWSEIESFFC